MEKNEFKKYLCVFDLDGTLLNNEKEITSENKKAISVLQKLGVGVMVATGRSKLMTDIFLNDLSLDMPLISNNGALVTQEGVDEPIYINSFSDNVRDKIIVRCHERGLEYFFNSHKNIYFSSKFGKIEIKHLRNAMLADKTGGFITLPEDKKEVIKVFSENSSLQILKVLVYLPENEDIKYFNTLQGVECVFSQAAAVDVMPKGSNKGKALEKTTKILGYNRENIFAFGDYDNDYEMLAYSGHPVAMGNAVDRLKEIAEYIAPSCDENGVARAIKDFVLPIIMGE